MKKKKVTTTRRDPVISIDPPFAEIVKRVLGEEYYQRHDTQTIEVSWITGGLTGGNCYGDMADRSVEADVEPEFEELDRLLEALCPTITYFQYKRLARDVIERGTERDRHYFANYYEKAFKRAKLDVLENYIRNNKLWDG